MDDETRLRDRAITLAGVAGENVEVPSANPVNYHQAVDDPAAASRWSWTGSCSCRRPTGPYPW